MKLFTALIAFFALNFSYAQSWDFNAPNYNEIEKACANADGVLYYPNLLERFKAADTSLSLEELRHLYYGYVFTSEYSPYGGSDYQDSIRSISSGDSLSFNKEQT